jgi:tetratricopeptide (TPR) repeat protein
MSGKFEEAVKPLERAIRLSPMPRSYYFEFLGFAYTGTRRYQEAIAAFEEGLARDRDSVAIRVGLAGAYAKMGRSAQARKIMAELLRQHPDMSSHRLAFMIPMGDHASVHLLAHVLRDAGGN